MSLAQFPLATTITAESTALVAAPLKGTLVGCEHALFAGAGMLAPPAGVWLLHNAGIVGLGAVSALVYAALTTAWLGAATASSELAGDGKRPAHVDGESASLLAAKQQSADDGASALDENSALAPNCVKRTGAKAGLC